MLIFHLSKLSNKAVVFAAALTCTASGYDMAVVIDHCCWKTLSRIVLERVTSCLHHPTDGLDFVIIE